MVDEKRSVIVRVDKITGEYFVSPDMMRNYYDFPEAAQLCEKLQAQMGELCDFFIIPYIFAITLISAELTLKAKYAENPDNKVIIN